MVQVQMGTCGILPLKFCWLKASQFSHVRRTGTVARRVARRTPYFAHNKDIWQHIFKIFPGKITSGCA